LPDRIGPIAINQWRSVGDVPGRFFRTLGLVSIFFSRLTAAGDSPDDRQEGDGEANYRVAIHDLKICAKVQFFVCQKVNWILIPLRRKQNSFFIGV
jgi:hypothetical protein